jgi:hypothetical protein
LKRGRFVFGMDARQDLNKFLDNVKGESCRR